MAKYAMTSVRTTCSHVCLYVMQNVHVTSSSRMSLRVYFQRVYTANYAMTSVRTTCWYVCIYDMQKVHVTSSSRMGWLRLVGSFKLQVSFAKETYKRDDILQKRPIILMSLQIGATP